MENVATTIEFQGYRSDVISPLLLGTNTLFHADRVSVGSDFTAVIAELGTTLIRYPGGTISEQFFDLSAPNNTTVVNLLDAISGVVSPETREVQPLDEFLSYVDSIGGTTSIVLPTYRYFDTTARTLIDDAELEIRTFVRKLLSGEFGPLRDIIFELGNEWYQSSFEWSSAEFGAVQATIASWVHDEASSLLMRDQVTILAQAGQSESENLILGDYFSGAAQESIDGVLAHIYGTTSTEDAFRIGAGIGRRLNLINEIWTDVLGDDFEFAITEWNVGANQEGNTSITGLMRLAPLMRMFVEMLEVGVDIATIWSTQTAGPSGLSLREGTGSQLTPTGQFFSLISHSLEGTRLIETGESDFILDGDGSKIGYRYSFSDENELITYFVSSSDAPFDVSASLGDFLTEDSYVYISTVGAAFDDDGLGFWSETSVHVNTSVDIAELPSNGSGLNVSLDPYHLVEIHVVNGSGVDISGDMHNAIDDNLLGSNFSDTLRGNLGDDFLSGKNGEDQLYGGSGNDTIFGGAGDDVLSPGLGGGMVDGGQGQDTIIFDGSEGGVSLWQKIGVVEIGSDQLRFEGIEKFVGTEQSDNFSIFSADHTFWGKGGNDTFNIHSGTNINVVSGSGDDFIFIMSGTNNYIDGGSGNDDFIDYTGGNTFSGSPGDDCFVFLGSSENTFEFKTGDGHDEINGFKVGRDALKIFGGHQDQISILQSEGGTTIELSLADSIFLVGVTTLTISDIDFI